MSVCGPGAARNFNSTPRLTALAGPQDRAAERRSWTTIEGQVGLGRRRRNSTK